MIAYFDAGSLIKLYVEEEGTEDVRRLLASVSAAATSRVTMCEVLAGLGRKARESRVQESDREAVVAAFLANWEHVIQIELDEKGAGRLAIEHSLRALDAIHLAAALELQAAGPEAVVFSSFDSRLNRAAVRVGISLPPGTKTDKRDSQR